MNGFDIAALVLVGLAARRGYRSGLAAEFYRLFRLVVAIFAGTSLYKMFSGAVSGLLHVDSGLSDPVLFVAALIGAWTLLRRMRRWVEALLLARTPQRVQAVGGAIAAGLKTGLLIIAVVTAVSLSSWLPGREWIAEESITGKIVHFFLPET